LPGSTCLVRRRNAIATRLARGGFARHAKPLTRPRGLPIGAQRTGAASARPRRAGTAREAGERAARW